MRNAVMSGMTLATRGRRGSAYERLANAGAAGAGARTAGVPLALVARARVGARARDPARHSRGAHSRGDHEHRRAADVDQRAASPEAGGDADGRRADRAVRELHAQPAARVRTSARSASTSPMAIARCYACAHVETVARRRRADLLQRRAAGSCTTRLRSYKRLPARRRAARGGAGRGAVALPGDHETMRRARGGHRAHSDWSRRCLRVTARATSVTPYGGSSGEIVGPTRERHERLSTLTPGGGLPRRSMPTSTGCSRVLQGESVLLIDDTWTTGASAQSAAAALETPARVPVAAVVIGRHLNREWHENDRRLRGIRARSTGAHARYVQRCRRCRRSTLTS